MIINMFQLNEKYSINRILDNPHQMELLIDADLVDFWSNNSNKHRAAQLLYFIHLLAARIVSH